MVRTHEESGDAYNFASINTGQESAFPVVDCGDAFTKVMCGVLLELDGE